MKIEKLNDNQIRCTLNKQDLTERQLRLSELAYGTEKAKALFQDMIQQAFYQFGFEAHDIPLMIEAIPVDHECLVLIITKVENPDELDTRFSKFTDETDFNEKEEEDSEAYADEIINTFEQLEQILTEEEKKEITDFNTINDKVTGEKGHRTADMIKIFSFRSLEEVTRMSYQIANMYFGESDLYKDPAQGRYYLIISKAQHTPREFNKVCNIISEFGTTEQVVYAAESYIFEHFEPIIKESAIHLLSVL